MSFEEKLAKLRNEKFFDTEFPAQLSSLMFELDEKHENWGKCIWKRASDIPCLKDIDGNQSIFLDDISPYDIKQGGLASCYLLSVLSVLAEHPERIKKLFYTEKINP